MADSILVTSRINWVLTFKRRVTVGVLVVGLILVGWGALSAAEWMASAIQVVQGAAMVGVG